MRRKIDIKPEEMSFIYNNREFQEAMNDHWGNMPIFIHPITLKCRHLCYIEASEGLSTTNWHA